MPTRSYTKAAFHGSMPKSNTAKGVALTQTIPLKVKEESRIFAVTLVVNRSRLIELLKDDDMGLGVLSTRRLTMDDYDALDHDRDEDNEDNEDYEGE